MPCSLSCLRSSCTRSLASDVDLRSPRTSPSKPDGRPAACFARPPSREEEKADISGFGAPRRPSVSEDAAAAESAAGSFGLAGRDRSRALSNKKDADVSVFSEESKQLARWGGKPECLPERKLEETGRERDESGKPLETGMLFLWVNAEGVEEERAHDPGCAEGKIRPKQDGNSEGRMEAWPTKALSDCTPQTCPNYRKRMYGYMCKHPCV